MSDTASIEMPKYKCTKEVWALKIKDVNIYDSDGNGELIFEEPGYANIDLPGEYFRKHEPYSGGFYVVYKGGYSSFSPPDVFDDGYTKI